MPADAAAEQGQNEDAGVERLLSKIEPLIAKGDSAALVALVKEYGHDNADLRAKNRELARDLKAAQGKVKDGDLVLTGDDAKSWVSLGKLNIPAKDIPGKLAAADLALKENGDFKRDGIAEEAAKTLEWNPKVLKGLVRLNNLKLDVKVEPDPEGGEDESGKKKKIRTVVVLGEKEDDASVPLDEYVDEHLGDFRDALAGAEAARKSDREPPTPQGPRHMRQVSGEMGRGKGVTEKELEQEVQQRHRFRV